MARYAAGNLVIGRGLAVSAGKAGANVHDALYMLVDRFDAPEAATGKDRHFSLGRCWLVELGRRHVCRGLGFIIEANNGWQGDRGGSGRECEAYPGYRGHIPTITSQGIATKAIRRKDGFELLNATKEW